MLLAKQTTLQHVRCNRKADLLAKEIAHHDSAIAIEDKKLLLDAIAGRQEWLVALNKKFGEDVKTSKANETLPPTEVATVDFPTMFPRWLWHANPGRYVATTFLPEIMPPKKWKWSGNSWAVVLDFVKALKWQKKATHEVAFIELTYVFHKRGFRLAEIDPQEKTLRDLHQLIRIALRHIHASGFLPGEWKDAQNKSWGRHLPTGCIQGAIPWFSDVELEHFASVLLDGAGGQMHSWSFLLADCMFF